MELVFYAVLTVVIVLLVARQCKTHKKERSGAASALYLARDNSSEKSQQPKPKLKLVVSQGNAAEKLSIDPRSKQANLKLVHNKAKIQPISKAGDK